MEVVAPGGGVEGCLSGDSNDWGLVAQADRGRKRTGSCGRKASGRGGEDEGLRWNSSPEAAPAAVAALPVVCLLSDRLQ